jgi:glycosyltransferase involved in cell wall biosynthesis
VVLGCRNEAEHLPQQLEALAAQRSDGWIDTVVVDDGSTDGTAAVAEAFADRLPGLRVVRTPPLGRASALNTGIAQSRGEAIVMVDGDDEVAPGYLQAMRSALAEHPAVAGRIDHEALNPSWMHGVRSTDQSTGLTAAPQHAAPVGGGGTLGVWRSALEQVHGYDESVIYSQDSDLCWQLWHAGTRLTWVPDAVLRYRHRTTVRATFAQSRRYGRGNALLDLRWDHASSPWVVAKRVLRLVAVVRRAPWWGDRNVRVASAFEAGLRFGWLEGRLAPRRLFSAEAMRRQRPEG